MSHLRLLTVAGEAIEEASRQDPRPELAERMHAERKAGSIEAALHIWGARIRASRGADVAWRTTRPPWPCEGRLDRWWSPVWLPTAAGERTKPEAPFRLASLFDQAA